MNKHICDICNQVFYLDRLEGYEGYIEGDHVEVLLYPKCLRNGKEGLNA